MWAVLTFLAGMAIRGIAELVGLVCGGALWLASLCVDRLGEWRRYESSLGTELRCPYCHARCPADGRFDCACGARWNGWVFDHCPNCGETCGGTPCPECGGTITNPQLRR